MLAMRPTVSVALALVLALFASWLLPFAQLLYLPAWLFLSVILPIPVCLISDRWHAWLGGFVNAALAVAIVVGSKHEHPFVWSPAPYLAVGSFTVFLGAVWGALLGAVLLDPPR